MPLSKAASLRARPSSTNAKASMRRTCAPSVHLPASTRNSALVWSAQVTFNVAPIDPPEANRLLRTSNQISPPWGIRPESQGPCRLVLAEDAGKHELLPGHQAQRMPRLWAL